MSGQNSLFQSPFLEYAEQSRSPAIGTNLWFRFVAEMRVIG